MDLRKTIGNALVHLGRRISPEVAGDPDSGAGDTMPSADEDQLTLNELPAAAPVGTPPAFYESDATDLSEAAMRHAATRQNDPFPSIAPALLNSADIEDYVVQAGMVWPYRPEPERLKSASYAMGIGEHIAYWAPEAPDTSSNPVRTVALGETFDIPSNSLVYVQTDEVLFLPEYIAVRLNLHIDLVHKGLLLGTGPIVDPGFAGKLVVPLHNLTSNNYVLARGDDFIWVEFTKTSDLPKWKEWTEASEELGRSGTFKGLPRRKIAKPLEFYLNNARQGHKTQPGFIYPALRNAIPKKISESSRTAHRAMSDSRRASKKVDSIRSWGIGIGVVSVVAAVIGFGSVIYAGFVSLQSTLELVGDTGNKIAEVNGRLDKVSRCVKMIDAAVPGKGVKQGQSAPIAQRPCANLPLDP